MNISKNKPCKNCINCSFRSPLFEFLSQDELKLINENRFEINFRPGETIRKQGTFLSHVISINDGLAKLYLEGHGDKKLILRIMNTEKLRNISAFG